MKQSVEELRSLLEKAVPLPWTTRRADCAIIAPSGKIIAEAFGRFSETERHDSGVNAALIAAAVNALPALLDRLAFLERVAEQMVDFAEIKPEEFREGTMYSRSTYDANGKPFDFVFPDLAAYLRARAAAGAGDSGVEK